MAIFSSLRFASIIAVLAVAPIHGAIAGEAEELVSRAARNWLADWAKQERLPDAQIDVVVLPNRRPAPACGSAMKIFPADTSQLSRLRFAARCPDGRAETYTVRAAVRTKVFAVAAAVPAGKAIGEDDLKQVDYDIALAPDALRDADEVAGRASQRPLRAGQVVQRRFLKAGEGVRRGQAVQIVSRQHRFQIHAAGTAMQKGDGDAMVRVRNDATGKFFMARVVGPGVVEPVAGAAITGPAGSLRED
ncbi:flagellar basal body P-ring formation protein FlgA [Dyella jejuensis]|uniref:Flagella basal body P-ring formation protein FlgA n=1 Tax=Dyella jejuensis TaxID=1432009 RepID=A0ABW8JJT7_9GAMM